jgi:hypothetical protein
MTEQRQLTDNTKARRVTLLAAACVLLFVLAGWAATVLLRTHESDTQGSDTGVPLGVEQAVIIRYRGPRLQAQPYRRGASVNLRIADQAQTGRVRVYDIRYVISLPGEFDLTKYLASADGQPIDDLPPFRVRGLTSLTKDIETRIQEIENVDVHIGHWYYESLAGAGVLWAAWLVGLIFIGRPKRPPLPPPAARQPSLVEQIDRLLATLTRGELTTAEKARLEALLLKHWRAQLGLDTQRMSVSCRDMEASAELGQAYGKLQAWLHNPRAGVDAEEFVGSYTRNPGSDVQNSILPEDSLTPRRVDDRQN